MDGGYPEVDKWFQQGIKWIIYVLLKESKGRKSGVFGGATPSKHFKNVLGRRRLYLDICVIGVEASSAHSNQAYVPIYRVYNILINWSGSGQKKKVSKCISHCLCLRLCHCLFSGRVMSPHHSDQMSQRSQVSRIAR